MSGSFLVVGPVIKSLEVMIPVFLRDLPHGFKHLRHRSPGTRQIDATCQFKGKRIAGGVPKASGDAEGYCDEGAGGNWEY